MDIITLPPKEWQAYKALRLRALLEEPQAFSSLYADALTIPEETWMTRLQEASEAKRNWLLFARENGRLVGMVGAYMEPGAGDVATVVSVYVPQEERGRGIGARLTESILDALSAKPFLRRAKLMVNPHQTPALGLYRKFGFRQTGTHAVRMGDGNLVDELTMERSLPSPSEGPS